MGANKKIQGTQKAAPLISALGIVTHQKNEPYFFTTIEAILS